MQWNEYPGLISKSIKKLKKSGTLDRKATVTDFVKMVSESGETSLRVEVATEYAWTLEGRPFYNVYPSIGKSLSKINVDFDCEHILNGAQKIKNKYGISTILIRWAVGHECIEDIKSCLCYVTTNPTNGKESLFLSAVRNRTTKEGLPRHAIQSVSLVRGRKFEKSLLILQDKQKSKTCDDIARTAASIFLIAGSENSDFIEPVVLKEHQKLFDESGDSKYIEKAKNRGMFGWSIGKRIEVSPHVRLPHLGYRWKGKGRSELALVPISGCIVNKKKINEVPHGYLDDHAN